MNNLPTGKVILKSIHCIQTYTFISGDLLFSGEMELSDMPVLGDWTISVSAHVRMMKIINTVWH